MPLFFWENRKHRKSLPGKLTAQSIWYYNPNEKAEKYEKEDAVSMTLYDGQKDGQYTVNGLYLEEGITRRLQALGLNDGTTVKVLNRRKKGAMIIQVRGTRLALGKHIAAGIEVVSGSKEKAGKEGGSYDAD